MTTLEIERAIESILGKSITDKPERPRRRGRIPCEKPPIWSLNFYNPARNTTYALISMCIKDDFDQSLPELARRLAKYKNRPFRECLTIIRELQASGKLGYYDDDTLYFHTWRGEA